ncbi:MAG: phosphoribosylformylglycinamidine cyclo-ligase [Fibrobacterota bacterium]|nr:phosphoribosylformylglycinamidine cyclo-ligase [Fibrobacterota bacterium]QQS05136.1 MAG: phosphoribosylformylglycinamidine cyclo-ligase [Fibrobacterota bacterium]
MNYAEAGVSLERSDKVKNNIAQAVKSTFGPRVMGGFGGFGGCFDARNLGVEPVLVSSCDGVGTKLKLAFQSGIHNTVGQDIVNHCVDDILVQGAKPLFFLDYIATGKLHDGVVEGIVDGVAKACRENGASLIGGETAEMPGFYPDGEYDLAGYIVGVVERENLLDGSRIKAGNTILALGSAGLHTNGYSLARKVFFDKAGLSLDARLDGLNGSLREALMAPHRSYLKALLPLVEEKAVNGMVHLTGGGFQGNIPRVLPADCDAVIDRRTWEVPALFRHIADLGQIERDEMDRTFNMGLGMLVMVDADRAEELRARLVEAGETVHVVGHIAKGSNTVRLLG